MFVAYILSKIRGNRRYHQSVRELMRLSDRELADVGISRYEIEMIASRQKAIS